MGRAVGGGLLEQKWRWALTWNIRGISLILRFRVKATNWSASHRAFTSDLWSFVNLVVCEGIRISEGLSQDNVSLALGKNACVCTCVGMHVCGHAHVTACMWSNFNERTLSFHRVDPGDGIELRSSGLAASTTTTEPFRCCSVYPTAHQCSSFFQRTHVWFRCFSLLCFCCNLYFPSLLDAYCAL